MVWSSPVWYRRSKQVTARHKSERRTPQGSQLVLCNHGLGIEKQAVIGLVMSSTLPCAKARSRAANGSRVRACARVYVPACLRVCMCRCWFLHRDDGGSSRPCLRILAWSAPCSSRPTCAPASRRASVLRRRVLTLGVTASRIAEVSRRAGINDLCAGVIGLPLAPWPNG